MKKIFYILACVCAAVLVTSCGSSKRLVNPNDKKEDQAKLEVEKTRFEEVLKNSYDFTLMQSKAKYSLGDKSLNGRLNVEHGKRLCMTVTVLGIEIARVEADEKKVVLVDKFDKLYTELTIAEFAEKFGLQDEMCYDALECLILGRMFLPGSGEVDAKDFKKMSWNIDDKDQMTGVLNKDKYVLTYYISPDNKLEETLVRVKKQDSEAMAGWRYSGYQPIESGQFVAAETIALETADLQISAQLSLSAPTMGKTWTSFKPSSAYKQVGLKELIEAIKKLKS